MNPTSPGHRIEKHEISSSTRPQSLGKKLSVRLIKRMEKKRATRQVLQAGERHERRLLRIPRISKGGFAAAMQKRRKKGQPPARPSTRPDSEKGEDGKNLCSLVSLHVLCFRLEGKKRRYCPRSSCARGKEKKKNLKGAVARKGREEKLQGLIKRVPPDNGESFAFPEARQSGGKGRRRRLKLPLLGNRKHRREKRRKGIALGIRIWTTENFSRFTKKKKRGRQYRKERFSVAAPEHRCKKKREPGILPYRLTAAGTGRRRVPFPIEIGTQRKKKKKPQKTGATSLQEKSYPWQNPVSAFQLVEGGEPIPAGEKNRITRTVNEKTIGNKPIPSPSPDRLLPYQRKGGEEGFAERQPHHFFSKGKTKKNGTGVYGPSDTKTLKGGK